MCGRNAIGMQKINFFSKIFQHFTGSFWDCWAQFFSLKKHPWSFKIWCLKKNTTICIIFLKWQSFFHLLTHCGNLSKRWKGSSVSSLNCVYSMLPPPPLCCPLTYLVVYNGCIGCKPAVSKVLAQMECLECAIRVSRKLQLPSKELFFFYFFFLQMDPMCIRRQTVGSNWDPRISSVVSTEGKINENFVKSYILCRHIKLEYLLFLQIICLQMSLFLNYKRNPFLS